MRLAEELINLAAEVKALVPRSVDKIMEDPKDFTDFRMQVFRMLEFPLLEARSKLFCIKRGAPMRGRLTLKDDSHAG